MKINMKKYPVSRDFEIECSTVMSDMGTKTFSVAVYQLGLPFEIPLEEVSGITSPERANTIFKSMCQKYKNQNLSFL